MSSFEFTQQKDQTWFAPETKAAVKRYNRGVTECTKAREAAADAGAKVEAILADTPPFKEAVARVAASRREAYELARRELALMRQAGALDVMIKTDRAAQHRALHAKWSDLSNEQQAALEASGYDSETAREAAAGHEKVRAARLAIIDLDEEYPPQFNALRDLAGPRNIEAAERALAEIVARLVG